MATLSFRAPGVTLPLRDLLQRALPNATARELRNAAEQGHLSIDQIPERDLRMRVPAGARLEMTFPTSDPDRVTHHDPARIVQQTPHWSLVMKPVGLEGDHTHEATRAHVATWLDRPVEEVYPVHSLDTAVYGLWLIAHDAPTGRRLSQAFLERRASVVYHALVPELVWDRGLWDGRLDGKKAHTAFHVLERRGSVALVRLNPHTTRTHQVRRHCAQSGCPILGDTLYTGRLVSGGLRLVAVGLQMDDEPELNVEVEVPLEWPQEPVFPLEETTPLHVSEATLRALDRGHPWVLTDTETFGAGRARRGSTVRLTTERPANEVLAKPISRDRKKLSVLIEGEGIVAGRLWSIPRLPGSLKERVFAALKRRRAILEHPQRTDALRLVHGEADGFPGLHIDLLGDTLRVLQTGEAANLIVQPTVRALCAALDRPVRQVVEVLHLKYTPSGTFESVRSSEPAPQAPPEAPSETGHIVSERGLRYWVDAGLGEPERARPGIGLFLDQRVNRDRLSMYARRLQGRWLNLFAHTGAFSVSLLRDGVEHVTSVDLSRPYLDWLDANIALNPELPAERHESVRRDVRRFLNSLPPGASFEGIVLDPPTAAAAGRTFWSVRQGGSELIAACLDLLVPGGVLLVTRNDRKHRGNLQELVEQTAWDHRVPLEDCIPAPPGPDFPSLRGFPEGDPFEGLIAVRGMPGADLRPVTQTVKPKPSRKRGGGRGARSGAASGEASSHRGASKPSRGSYAKNTSGSKSSTSKGRSSKGGRGRKKKR